MRARPMNRRTVTVSTTGPKPLDPSVLWNAGVVDVPVASKSPFSAAWPMFQSDLPAALNRMARTGCPEGVAMTAFAQDRTAFESLLACVDGRAGKDAVAPCLAENVVLNSPILDEPVTGRDAVADVLQALHALGALTTGRHSAAGPPVRVVPAAGASRGTPFITARRCLTASGDGPAEPAVPGSPR